MFREEYENIQIGETGMAKRKVTKHVRRWRNEREQRRLANAGDKMWNVLEGKNPRDRVTIFSAREKMRHFAKLGAFGTIVCPLCGYVKAYVSNPAGVNGNPDNDYIMTHKKLHRPYDCDASGLLLKNLFSSNGVRV